MSRAGAPAVTIGLPAYQPGPHFDEAVGSILAQTFTDFRLHIFVEPSDDPRPHQHDLNRDPRVRWTTNPTRLGLIANWQRALSSAESDYFAWASDHDLWAPTWLETLASRLDSQPDAVLAYPVVGRIPPTRQTPWEFDTQGIAQPHVRLLACARHLRAGDMVYGLFRRTALQDSGGLPQCLLPDRALLLLMSIRGTFVQTSDLLWWRRVTAPFSVRRQRDRLFGPGESGPPQPWWIQHTALLLRDPKFFPELSPVRRAVIASRVLTEGARIAVRTRLVSADA